MTLLSPYLLIEDHPPHPLADPSGPKLEILNISNPAYPIRVSISPFMGGIIEIANPSGTLTFSGNFNVQTESFPTNTVINADTSTLPETLSMNLPSFPQEVMLGATTTVPFQFHSPLSGIATTSASMNEMPIISGQIITFNMPGTTTFAYFIQSKAGSSIMFTQQVYVDPPLTRSIVQVGNLTLATYCNAKHTVDHIDVVNGSTTIQTMNHVGIEPAGGSCPQPESVGTDSVPAFSIFSDQGGPNTDSELWVFNTSTQQFVSMGNFADLYYDPSSQTVTSNAVLGCAGDCRSSFTYQIIDNKLVLEQETDIDEIDGARTSTLLVTSKTLVNGQMVITTSTMSQADEWRACLAAGTSVLMKDGSYENIEDIQAGDSVVSLDATTGKRIDTSVTSVIHRQDPIITINGVLKAAPDEPLYLANRQTTMAGSLKIGDRLLSENGSPIVVSKIAYSAAEVPTYDLILQNGQNFFADGYLVQSVPNETLNLP
jgi:hypothetical protein